MGKYTTARLDDSTVKALLQVGWIKWSKSKKRYNLNPLGVYKLQRYCEKQLRQIPDESNQTTPRDES